MSALLPRPILPPSIQAKMELGAPGLRPLGDTNAAMRDLDLTAAEIRELVEMGVLIGFNVASTKGATALRVLTRSIEHFKQNQGREYPNLEWPEIFRIIIPHEKPAVTGLEIQRALNCDRRLVENLVNAGELVALQKSKPGPGGSWIISRASVEAFLKARQL